KRRVRAGMGRCQGGFCSPRVMDLLKKYRNVPMTEVTKSGGKSQIVFGYSKKSEEV
ncbi:MAG: FAD/NAD(P)-binding oxidoreductase, partial [Lachnospiraceae bacterium]|nr:FAD/NAD(P)-binding oxidoreductase [Lachnospiraceae bacterium]